MSFFFFLFFMCFFFCFCCCYCFIELSSNEKYRWCRFLDFLPIFDSEIKNCADKSSNSFKVITMWLNRIVVIWNCLTRRCLFEPKVLFYTVLIWKLKQKTWKNIEQNGKNDCFKNFKKNICIYRLIDCNQSLNWAFPSGVIWNAALAAKIMLAKSS